MADVKQRAAEEKARLHTERQQQLQEQKAAAKAARIERMQHEAEARAIEKAARAARHAEMTREQQLQKEEKQKLKQQNKLISDHKQQEDRKKRIERQQREVNVNVDMKSLKEAVKDHYNKFGKVEKVDVAFSGTKLWNLSVTFEKKEDIKKALGKPPVPLSVGVVLEQVPIPEHSVHFDYLWYDGKDMSSWRPAGQPWEDLKKEIIRVFASKTQSAKPLFVSYKSKRVIVTYDSATARDVAVQQTAEGRHNWVVQGKQIPALSPSLPGPVSNKKRKQPPAAPGTASKVQKVG